MRVKICGITTVEDALRAERLGADAVGMVVCSQSPRSVGLDRAAEIIGALGPFTASVCVTHTDSSGDLDLIIAICPSAIQISCPFLRPRPCPVRVIRVIEPGDEPRSDCDALIVDSSRGRGLPFDRGYARRIADHAPVPVILAGGLTPENVGDAIDSVRPYAVDVCSGVEVYPGVKDWLKVAAFIRASREAYQRCQ
jgi:phosphoribosylanthranilate isomerase